MAAGRDDMNEVLNYIRSVDNFHSDLAVFAGGAAGRVNSGYKLREADRERFDVDSMVPDRIGLEGLLDNDMTYAPNALVMFSRRNPVYLAFIVAKPFLGALAGKFMGEKRSFFRREGIQEFFDKFPAEGSDDMRMGTAFARAVLSEYTDVLMPLLRYRFVMGPYFPPAGPAIGLVRFLALMAVGRRDEAMRVLNAIRAMRGYGPGEGPAAAGGGGGGGGGRPPGGDHDDPMEFVRSETTDPLSRARTGDPMSGGKRRSKKKRSMKRRSAKRSKRSMKRRSKRSKRSKRRSAKRSKSRRRV